jgi:hypothetical protein
MFRKFLPHIHSDRPHDDEAIHPVPSRPHEFFRKQLLRQIFRKRLLRQRDQIVVSSGEHAPAREVSDPRIEGQFRAMVP